MKILVTGATGFIGQRLSRELANKGHQLFILVRLQSKKKAENMFLDIKGITIIEGDVEDTDVIKDLKVFEHLDSIESIVHLAAHYNLEASLSESYVNNVIGTQNIIHLMNKMKSIKHFYYFSTYAVNPVSQGQVTENDLVEDDLKLFDRYSKTKNHAEHIVRKQAPAHVKTVIFRPGIVIGDSVTGEMYKKDGPYFYFDFIETLKKMKVPTSIPFLPIPTTSESLFPVVPVDIITQWCSHIISRPPQDNLKCYHLVPSPVVKTKTFLEESMKLLGFPVKILPLKYTHLIAHLLPIVKIPKEAAIYMNQSTEFDRSNLNIDYPELTCPPYQQYLPILINAYLRHKK